MPSFTYPSDLAAIVGNQLSSRCANPPGESILKGIFEVVYFSSLRTEEGERISYSICYVNPDDPDPKPPEVIRAGRWQVTALASRIPFTIDSMVKLAKATDTRSSAFAVYNHGDSLYVWGLVDQSNSYHQFASHDREEGYERPGLFQVDILGVGHIKVTDVYEQLAELSSGMVLPKPLDVLKTGPVQTKLEAPVTSIVQALLPTTQASGGLYPTLARDLSHARRVALRRLLKRIQSFGHGGAILITADATSTSPPHLEIRYSLHYARLRDAIEQLIALEMLSYVTMKDIHDNYKPQQIIPYELYDRLGLSNLHLDDVKAELDNTLWFISLLTRIDGLVLLTPELELRGFGVMIRPGANAPSGSTPSTHMNAPNLRSSDNTNIEVADDVSANTTTTKPRTSYGARHLSMVQYCSLVSNSIGFVVSQDGAVRAITQVDGQVVLWENILLEREFPMSSVTEVSPTFTFGMP